MVQRTIVALEDDLEGGPADETVRFAFAGQNYQIDLTSKNAEKFRSSIARYIAAARTDLPGLGRRQSPTGTVQARTVRAWAQENGIAVNARGRVSAEVVAAFERSNL